MTNQIDQMLQFQQTALHLREVRQALIASNIANADTPGYQARDIDFANAMQNALSHPTSSVQPAGGAPQPLSGSTGATTSEVPVQYRSVVQPSADGNTVDMNIERGQFAENTIRYEASLKFVSQQIKDVLNVLQG